MFRGPKPNQLEIIKRRWFPFQNIFVKTEKTSNSQECETAANMMSLFTVPFTTSKEVNQ